MKYAIIITGDLAAGKSTLASRLSSIIGVGYFCKDNLTEVLADKVGFANREENKRLSYAAFGVMYLIAQQFIQTSNNIILEGDFRQNELELVKKIFEKNNYKVFTIVLEGELRTLYERYVYRNEYENRHFAHYAFKTYGEYEQYVMESRNRDFPGETYRIDTTDFNAISYDSINKMLIYLNLLDKKHVRNRPFLAGGSVCAKRISGNVIVKCCNINYEGIDNGYHKLFHEVEHIKKSNINNEKLYPNVVYERHNNDFYEVGYEFMYKGLTFADVIENGELNLQYAERSLEYIFSQLVDKLYTNRQMMKPDENYLDRFFFDRMYQRLDKTIELCNKKNICPELVDAIINGFTLNGEHYNSIYAYLDTLGADKELMGKLQIQCSTKSHHDLIPSNILVEMGECSVVDFRLIDPRGEIETGSNNRNIMYDIGKLLFGIGRYDIIRFHNGKTNTKVYQFEKVLTGNSIDYTLYYNRERGNIVEKCDILRERLLSLLSIELEEKVAEKNLVLKAFFSEFAMYISDIPCRIVDEESEEMCMMFLFQGVLQMKGFFEVAYGKDYFKLVNTLLDA